MMTDHRSRVVHLNGVDLHYVEAGDGPLVVLVHGLPQCWYMFRHQLAHLGQDHHAVALDLRGFNKSTAPSKLHETGVLASVDDVRALADHLGHRRLVIVGHDIGVAVAWSFTLHHPEMVAGLVTISGAHPALFDRRLREDPAQQKALGHWLLLRRPDAYERCSADDYAGLRVVFDGLPYFSDEDRAFYLDAWRRPGAVEGMVMWTRREGWGPPEGNTPAKGNYVPEVSPLTTDVPVLALYGDADPYILPVCYDGLDDYASNLTIRSVPGAGHWLPEQHPDLVNHYVREFIARLQDLR